MNQKDYELTTAAPGRRVVPKNVETAPAEKTPAPAARLPDPPQPPKPKQSTKAAPLESAAAAS